VAADNHTTIVGNLVEDPELRFTNTGIAEANMRVAVTQRIQQDGELERRLLLERSSSI
jgi:single-strand DNA-binding protein